MFEMLVNIKDNRPPLDPNVDPMRLTMCMEHSKNALGPMHVLSRDYKKYGDLDFVHLKDTNGYYSGRFVLRKDPGDNVPKPWLDHNNWTPSEVTLVAIHSRDTFISWQDYFNACDGQVFSTTPEHADFLWCEFIIDGVKTYVPTENIFTSIRYSEAIKRGLVYGHDAVDVIDIHSTVRPGAASVSKKVTLPDGDYYVTLPKGAASQVITTNWIDADYPEHTGTWYFTGPIPETMNSEWDQMRNAMTGLSIGVTT